MGDAQDLDEVPGFERPTGSIPRGEWGRVAPGDGPYSLAQESYREELAYDVARARSRKRMAALRVAAAVVLLPIALVAVFVVAFALTCIVNGASPDELAVLMQNLFERVRAFAMELLAGA